MAASKPSGDSGDLGGHWHVFRGHTARLVQVAFSPRGDYIVTASGDGTARVWNSETGRLRAVLTGHDGRINRVAVSPDGSRIATGRIDRTARIWNASNGALVATLSLTKNAVNWVEFSPDGTLLLTANQDGKIHVCDAATGASVIALQGNKGTDSVVCRVSGSSGTRAVRELGRGQVARHSAYSTPSQEATGTAIGPS